MNVSTLIWVGAVVLGSAVSHQAPAQVREESSPPDLSGVWLLDGGTATFSSEPPPAMTVRAMERLAANRPTVGPNAVLEANDPTVGCLPPGVPYVLTIPTPFEIIQLDDQILQIFEYDHSLRRIHTDGRMRPSDLQQTKMYQWMGYSIGRWEGNVLVVETSGFNDKSWLDRSGHPHSDELVVTERLTRVDHETLVNEITISDAKSYAKPWHGRMVFRLKEDWELFEHVCVSEDTSNPEYRRYKERAWRPAE